MATVLRDNAYLEAAIYFFRFGKEADSTTMVSARLKPFVDFFQTRYTEIIELFYEDGAYPDISRLWQKNPICGDFFPLQYGVSAGFLFRLKAEDLFEYLCASEMGLDLNGVQITYETTDGPPPPKFLWRIWIVHKVDSVGNFDGLPYFFISKARTNFTRRSFEFEIMSSSSIKATPEMVPENDDEKIPVPKIGVVLMDTEIEAQLNNLNSESPFVIFFFLDDQDKKTPEDFGAFNSMLTARKTQYYYLQDKISFFRGLPDNTSKHKIVYASPDVFEIAQKILNF